MKTSMWSGLLAMIIGLVFLFSTPALATCSEDAVNINTATVEELQEVNGIGEVLAQRIVDYRQEHPFESEKEITVVKGIGTKTFKKMEDSICAE